MVAMAKVPVPIRPVQERSFVRAFEQWVQSQPTAPAVICAATERTLSYEALHAEGLGFAALLRSAGAKVGDHVGIMLPNGLEWVISWAGATLGGFVDVAVDVDAKSSILEHFIAAADVTTLICHAEQLQVLKQIAMPASVKNILVWGGVAEERNSNAQFTYRSVPAQLTTDDAPVVYRDPRADTSIRYTSGTTGPAKPAVLTESHLEVWAYHFNTLMGAERGDRLFTPFPLSHHLASVLGVLAMLYAGATCVIDVKFSRSGYWGTIRKYDATLIHTISPTISLLMSAPESPEDRDHNVRCGYIGIPNTGFEERFGIKLLVAYGLTEGNMLTYLEAGDEGPQEHSSHQIGGQVLGSKNPHFDIAVLDEWDQECPPGVRGNLSFRPRIPYSTLQRYHNADSALRKASGNQWFHTGDVAAFDSEGYMHFFGRSGDTIRRKGHNIATHHIEEISRRYAGVSDAAVVPVPSSLGESDLKLVVLKESTAVSLDLRELFVYLRGELSPVMVPSYVEVRSEVPRTRTLKILKSALTHDALNDQTFRTDDWTPAV